MTGAHWLVEIMGAGAAIFDFDGDGRMDIWLVQGGPLENSDAPPCDRLYRNATKGGRLRFVDVTEAAGICADGYGMGVATGDIDNDGDLDVFVANFGANQLFENLGNGRFRDISARARIADDDSWSVSASFADVDGDGFKDLYVANYVLFSLADHKPCKDDFGQPSYCSPVVYKGAADRLYRNLGAGAFEDISTTSRHRPSHGCGPRRGSRRFRWRPRCRFLRRQRHDGQPCSGSTRATARSRTTPCWPAPPPTATAWWKPAWASPRRISMPTATWTCS